MYTSDDVIMGGVSSRAGGALKWAALGGRQRQGQAALAAWHPWTA